MVMQLIRWARCKPSQIWFVVWHLLRLTHGLDGMIMKWQQAREAFEKSFVIPELTNIYQVLALTVRNITNMPTTIKVTLLMQTSRQFSHSLTGHVYTT